MTKGSLTGEYAPRIKTRGLKERVHMISRSLNSIKRNGKRQALWLNKPTSGKPLGLGLTMAIMLSLLVGAHSAAIAREISMDNVYLKEFKEPDPDAFVELTLHLPLVGVGTPELYRLNIKLPPRLIREFKFVGSRNYMTEGNGVFLHLNEPGFIMLAVEDDKASLRPYQELYYRETQNGPGSGLRDYTNTEHHVDYGKKYERKEPTGIGAILADSKFQAAAKWVISLTPLGFLQDTAEAIDAFVGKKETWAVATRRPENPPRKYFEYSSPEKAKDPYRAFTNDEIYDIRTVGWDRLRAYGSAGDGYKGTEGYDINYLFKLKRTRPEVVTFLFIRVVIPYVHISSYGGRESLYPYGRFRTKYAEIEWRVKLPAQGAEPSKEVKTPTARYELIPSEATWEEAKKDCEKRGGHLATITSEEENDTVARLLRDNGVVEAWIGLTDKDKEKDWKWITGEERVYEAWTPGEPNDTGGVEDCALIFGDDGKWNDWGMPNNSKQKSFYVCEFEPMKPEEKAVPSEGEEVLTKPEEAEDKPPKVFISVTPEKIRVGETFRVLLKAEDDVGLRSMWWWGQSTGIPELDKKHTAGLFGKSAASVWKITATKEGTFTLAADARDREGHQASEGKGTAEATITVRDEEAVISPARTVDFNPEVPTSTQYSSTLGQTISVKGDKFAPNTTYIFKWSSGMMGFHPYLCEGEVTTNAEGSFDGTITLPAVALQRPGTLLCRDKQTDSTIATRSFEIEKAPL